VTPDKLDRSLRDKKITTDDGRLKPYPLTEEEEATSNIPRSEEISINGQKRQTIPRGRSNSSNDTRKNEMGKVASDYNKHISHPRKR
jgi:hypothetical protein